MTHSEFKAHTSPLFKKLNIMTFYQLYDYFVGLFVYRCLNHLLPEMFWNLFTRNVTSRNVNNVRPSGYTTKISEFSTIFTGPKIWNKLPDNIRLTKSLFSFKHKLKQFLK